jgi:NAD(P)-dependent dehydrogenase (short-subunit alcohol dehydrogenase family)
VTDPFELDGPTLRLRPRPYDADDLAALRAALAASADLTAVELTGATLPRAVALPLVDAIAVHPGVTRVRVGDALDADVREALVAALCAKPRPRLTARPLAPHDPPPVFEAPTEAELAACERVLTALAADASLGARHPRLRALAAKVARREERARDSSRRREKREQMRLARAARDHVRAAATGLRASRRGDAPAPEARGPDAVIDTFEQPRACYVCHAAYRGVHFFYDRLCPTCAAFNWEKREQTADLRGRVALVTGARVRIGYAVALKLLRAGATVVATTRFPRDAARRFAAERDFDDWRERLTVHGLDLRDLAGVERFAARLTASLPRLDVLVNNAAQTVWRPPSYYAHLAPMETAPRDELPEAVRAVLGEEGHATRALLGEGDAAMVRAGSDDGTGHPIDLRATNSWRLAPEDVETRELLETHAINTLAPYLLTVRLRGLMSRVADVDRWVVQVSSPEGLFARDYRSGLHAHTNMAKASLNMFVRTASERWARERLWMCAVDTGWVSNQNPLPIAERMDALGFAPPLDETDAAARVCDPVFVGAATGANVCGVYLKDYRPAAW